MADVTRSTLSAILKEDYLPPIVDQFNSKTLLLKHVQRRSRDVGGDGAYIPVMTERTHGHGARAEAGTLPTADANAYDQMTVSVKFNYSKIKVTGPSLAVARKDKYAFLRTLNAEVRGSTEGFINDFNRQMFGNGSGELSQCGVTSAANTVVLNTSDKDGGFGTRYIEPGMLVDIKVAATGADITAGADITVDSVDSAAGTFDFTGTAVTTAATNSVYVADNVGTAANSSNEAMGLHGIIADRDPSTLHPQATAGGLQGKAVATNDWWKASVLANGGTNRDLSESLMHDLLIAVDKRSGLGSEIDAFISAHEIWKEYGLLLTPDRRFAGTPDTYEGGFKYLVFDGLPWYFEKYCQPNRVYAVNWDHLILLEESPVRWDETDGSLLKWDGSTDGFEAFLVYYSNLATDRRQAHAVLEDINMTAVNV